MVGSAVERQAIAEKRDWHLYPLLRLMSDPDMIEPPLTLRFREGARSVPSVKKGLDWLLQI